MRGVPRTADAPAEHGTRGCYVAGPTGQGPGCHCGDCKRANTEYEAHRVRQILYGRWEPFADAEPVREHLERLRDARVGRRRVAELTGLSMAGLSAVMYGQHGNPPPSQVRAETARAILGIDLQDAPKLTRHRDGAGAMHRLQAMIAERWPQSSLAAEMGISVETVRTILQGKQVTPKVDEAVRDGYRRLWGQQPPASTPAERAAAGAAGQLAQRMGWAPRAAWATAELDRPDGQPDEGWERGPRVRHRSADIAEDAQFIMATQGCDATQAAERMGVDRNLVYQAIHRVAKQRERDTAEAGGQDHDAVVLHLPVAAEPELDAEPDEGLEAG
jgi:hypothetical protein